MQRKLIITIDTDEKAEHANFNTLMDTLQTICHEQVNEAVAMDSIEHNYYFSLYDQANNNVKISCHWEEEK